MNGLTLNVKPSFPLTASSFLSFDTRNVNHLFVGLTVATINAGTIVWGIDVLGTDDGVWYNVWTSAAHAGAATDVTSIGPRLPVNIALTKTARLTWTLAGGANNVVGSAAISGSTQRVTSAQG